MNAFATSSQRAVSTHFHKTRAISTKKYSQTPFPFGRVCEYLTNQRRSNPPVGESRQEPSENPKRLSQESRGRNFRRTGTGTRKGVGKGTPGNWKRNPQGDRGKNPQGNWKRLPQGNRGKDLKRESETRLAEAVGKPGANGWNPGKLLQRECDNGRGMGSAGSARGYRTILKWHSAVTWKPNQVFDQSESKG